jgi:hypothetical protein
LLKHEVFKVFGLPQAESARCEIETRERFRTEHEMGQAMREHLCCDRAAQYVRVARFGLRSAGWIAPSAFLAVVPKCPVCFAAYVTLLTGVGLSLTAAASLRVSLIVGCVGLVVYTTARSIHRVASSSK